jgi:peptidoglycan/LPS O-acetylase OafA/YrhL
LGLYLWKQGRPTATPTTILFVICAGVIGVVLLVLARRVREWNLPREAWVPVALVGTALLNPRVMKYDLAAITVPMLLIGGQAVRLLWKTRDSSRGDSSEKSRSGRTPILVGSILFFLIPNIITSVGPSWFPAEFLVLATIFVMGIWSLYRLRAEDQSAVLATLPPA